MTDHGNWHAAALTGELKEGEPHGVEIVFRHFGEFLMLRGLITRDAKVG